MTTFDREAFEAAHDRFLEDAKSLSDADLEQFEIVDPALAKRARLRREGYIKDTPHEDRAFEKKAVTMGLFANWLADYIHPIVAAAHHKNDLLEARIAELERQLTDTQTEVKCMAWLREQESAKR